MQTSKPPSGNVVHHNGDWSGPMEFQDQPTALDCVAVLALITDQEAVGAIKQSNYTQAGLWLKRRMDLDGLRRDIQKPSHNYHA